MGPAAPHRHPWTSGALRLHPRHPGPAPLATARQPPGGRQPRSRGPQRRETVQCPRSPAVGITDRAHIRSLPGGCSAPGETNQELRRRRAWPSCISSSTMTSWVIGHLPEPSMEDGCPPHHSPGPGALRAIGCNFPRRLRLRKVTRLV